MEPVRARAFKLRVAGKSYNEINRTLGVPKSTLSGWFRHIVLSDKARSRLVARSNLGTERLIKRNKMQTQRAEERARRIQTEGQKLIGPLSKQDLLIIGSVLYWAEGYKRLKIRGGKARMGHTISFVNSDPEMIRAFTRFLIETLSVAGKDIRLTMRLYAHINENEARGYWRRATRLQDVRFFKTTYLISGASKGARPYNRLPWGTLQVEVCDTSKFHYLLGMIEGVKKQLGHDKMASLPG